MKSIVIEEWKPVVGYEGLYEISNLGRVKSLTKWQGNKHIFSEHIIKPTDNGHGYMIVSLRKEGKRKSHYVHRLVATEFIENYKNYKYVNHIDYDKTNNKVNNLEWCTQKQNIIHSIPRMRHRKSITHTNTGEKYISFRKSKNVYRITINKKEYKTVKTLEEAIKMRDAILKEVV